MTTIRLRIDGMPQETSEAAALLINCALRFCAEPETFPVFQAYTLAKHADTDWVVEVMSTVSPEVLGQTSEMIAAGVVADFEEVGE